MSSSGTSRHFAALQNSVAIGGIADIEQAAAIKLELSARDALTSVASTFSSTVGGVDFLISNRWYGLSHEPTPSIAVISNPVDP
jgi:hypothetical protein